ncbi:uncharacterized protein DEA37_0000762 [Paragonimus westermani]|uniref:BTB domain-containing protein n=1 Tax=Paragonimus westermani TaxID=34504 RepID=A0A5J4NX78_9TREM|nr:uncharacterized protein DEA37_0000762 [Paragonimus westermani]
MCILNILIVNTFALAQPNLNEFRGSGLGDSTEASLTPVKLSCYRSNCFTSMVGKTLCSDATLVLEDGKCVPVHRFVFASWGVLDAVFPVRFLSSSRIFTVHEKNLHFSVHHLSLISLPIRCFLLKFSSLIGFQIAQADSNSVSVFEVSYDELLRLLFVLYNGDKNNLDQQWGSLSESSLRLLTRWGLNVRAVVNVSEFGRDEEGNLTLVRKDSPKQRAAFVGSPVLRTDDPLSHCSPVDFPQTPLISNSVPCDFAPQFSRDLFSSICDTPTEKTDTDVQDQDSSWVEHVPDLPSISLFKSNHGTSKESIFDEDCTPCPLIKRLRLSADEPAPAETSFPPLPNPSLDHLLAHSSIEPSVAGPSIAMGSTMDEPLRLAPTTPGSIRNNVTIEDVATWKTPLNQADRSSHSDSPITPLPNYVRMMTPELKVSSFVWTRCGDPSRLTWTC